MARSTYVYVVLLAGNPYAGFTVKHELVSFLRGKKTWATGVFVDLEVWRMPDGGRAGATRGPVVVDIAELLAVKCGATRNTVDYKPCILPPSHRWGCKSE